MTGAVPTGAYAYLPLERVVFGRPAEEAVVDEVERIGAARVFVVASKSIARDTPLAAAIAEALGRRFIGLFDECVQHTPRGAVIEAARAVRAAQPDLIVTVGGGTPIDTVKILQIALAHGVDDEAGLDGLHVSIDANGIRVLPAIEKSPVRQIIVPTTLSGAEFSNLGGAMNPKTSLKQLFIGTDIGARAVILDPRATVYTPDWLWLSTGLRAVDHAVESLCAIDANAYCDGLSLHALKLFKDCLPRSKTAPGDLAARLTCQQASWLAASTIARVEYGASHGISHALGAVANVPHGYTSCVLLPSVLAYNAPSTAGPQAMIAQALGRHGMSASEAVGDLIAALGLPRTLREVGVTRGQLPTIAENAMRNPWVRSNPRPIEGSDQVMAILEAAW